MAQGIRAQVAPLLAWAALGAAACGGPESTEGPPEPRPVDLATIPAGDLPDRVLDECQGPLRPGMAAVFAIVTLPNGDEHQVNARLPDAVRTSGPGGTFVLQGEHAQVLGEAPRAATAAELGRLHALRELLAAATFGPLRRAEACRRTAPATFELDVPGAGDPVVLRLRPGTLLPAAFVGPAGTITVDDYLRTPVAWVPSRLTHPDLGSCRIVFEKSGMSWHEGFFALAEDRPRTVPAQRIRMATDAVEARSATPALENAKAVRWLVLPDPGDWAQRAEAYKPLHDALLAEGQKIAGFAILTRWDDEDVLAIPFRPRSGDELPAVAEGRRVLEFEAGRELVVHPANGDFAAQRTAGERLLRAALQQRGLEADGAIRCQPYFHLDEGPPTETELAAPTVRMSVRVR